MSNGQGSTRNLAEGSQEAFRALINSIAPEAAAEKDGKLTPEAVEKLSEKLKELVGEDAVKDFEHRRNERGELVNEEGLPIIDISEPAPYPEAKEPEVHPVVHDVPLIRLSSLPSAAREKLRRQRDRILDALEEEERQENARQELADREEREEILRRRKEEAANEKARMQKAKELQKKMGKALMRNMGHSGKGNDSTAQEGRPRKRVDSQPDTSSEIRKKSVTFVETSNSTSNASKPEWGDVTAARLRSGKRPTLFQAFRSDSNPVKLRVIERNLVGHTLITSNRTPSVAQTVNDSDDESEPEDNRLRTASDGDKSDVVAEKAPDSEDAELELEEDEYDLDYARHQREIALEYYKKRNTIGQDAAKAMMNHTREDEDEPILDVPTPNNQPKPSISRFKANRIASAYGASTRTESSTSLAEAVLPQSTARTIQHAIRSGRIDDDNRLVGGEHDSDSENEDEGLQEVLGLLKKGEVYNLGPEGRYLYTGPKPQLDAASAIPVHASTEPHTTPSSDTTTQEQQQQQRQLPPLDRPKVSKFKVDRSQAGRPSTTPRSAASTPPSSGRSPPKHPSPLRETIVEKKQPKSTHTLESTPAYPSPSSRLDPKLNAPAQPFASTVIESPSFFNRFKEPTQLPIGAAPSPMVIDSPSFPPPGQRSRRPEHPPAVVSSQSLATGKTSQPNVAERPATPLSAPSITRSLSNPIVASIVQERVAPASTADRKDVGQNGSPNSAPKKVSRFKQARENHT